MAKGGWETLNPPERHRRYAFPNGVVLDFANVSRVRVSESGTHYLEYAITDGFDKAIVLTDGRVIYLDMDAWTF